MKFLIIALAIAFTAGCTPYTAEEYAELTAKKAKWNGPTGNVCMRTQHGQMMCNYSGR